MLALALAGLLAAAQPAPTGPAIPPATIDSTLEVTGEELDAKTRRNRLFIDVMVNDTGPWRFLVDSGADRSVVGIALSERLGLPSAGVAKLQSMSGASQVDTFTVDSLTIGRSEIPALRLPALPERFIGADGLIGIDALADQRLLMDFDRKTVTVQDSRRSVMTSEPGEIVVTARRRKGQLILTEAYIAGTQIYAVIDTGAEISIGNSALQERLLRGRRAPVQPITLLSVTGESLVANLIIVPEIRVGGILMRGVPVAFVDAPPFALFGLAKDPSLLLGTDVLQAFRRVALDFRNRKVRFTLR